MEDNRIRRVARAHAALRLLRRRIRKTEIMNQSASPARKTAVKFDTKTPMDFVVVGAGGAGAIVAKELSTVGFQVVVLEQGPYLHESSFRHDELKFKDTYDPPFIGQETLTNIHALQPN